ncbi:MAG TPA: hypothetical protein VJN21_13415 [Candidatus Acidoferrales bacterium]|nr:hypothetical protein [Candidatus Acidoferrales bacterium]
MWRTRRKYAGDGFNNDLSFNQIAGIHNSGLLVAELLYYREHFSSTGVDT